MYSIVSSPVPSRSFRESVQLAALENLLPDVEIEAICREIGHAWRKRQLPPGRTVRSMVYRGLHPDHSIAATSNIVEHLSVDPPALGGFCHSQRHRIGQRQCDRRSEADSFGWNFALFGGLMDHSPDEVICQDGGCHFIAYGLGSFAPQDVHLECSFQFSHSRLNAPSITVEFDDISSPVAAGIKQCGHPTKSVEVCRCGRTYDGSDVRIPELLNQVWRVGHR